MKLSKILIYCCLCLAVLLVSSDGFSRPLPDTPVGPDNNEVDRSPAPSTLDQVTHNLGNIATTIDNFGYIGGYSFYDLPSGEWPRNSGRHYLAEVRYWMGAVSAGGDTLVANTADDFQAITMPNDGADAYRIYLSTDTTRYYDYDPTDTTGIGMNRPAFGWRVWDPSASMWDYNEPYDPLASAFSPGGPASLQESYYRFNDEAEGAPVLGLEISQTGLQWNYCYNEDFLFFKLEITNTSAVNYPEFAFGLYIDIDVGGEDGTGENGRLEDLVAYDTLENLAWIYDRIGRDPGWGYDVQTGVMGTKLLSTPGDVGMTGLATNDWAFLPTTDVGRYEMIAPLGYDTPLPPTDQFYVQCVSGVSLNAGETIEIVYALVAGSSEESFRANAARAQELYDNNFVGPEPPNTPSLSASPGDGKVYLQWNDTAEVSIDPQSGVPDFKGYKLYRSDDLGVTWGAVNDEADNNCLKTEYYPIARYEAYSPGSPIAHSFVDTANLYNGVEYWYCLVAFDTGNAAFNVDPLQNGFGIAGQVANVVAVTPRSDPAGYYEAASTVQHVYNGTEQPSDGTIYPVVFDPDVVTGDDYTVVFEETPDTTYWHVINEATGDTVLQDQTLDTGDPNTYEVVDGLRVVVRNGDLMPRSMAQTEFGGSDTTLIAAAFYGPCVPTLAFSLGATPIYDTSLIYGDMHYRATYELRYTGDSTRATAADDPFFGTDTPYWVPFEAWNTTTNTRVSIGVFDFEWNFVWDPYDLLCVINYPYDSTASVTSTAFPVYYSWLFGLDDLAYAPQVGDVFTIGGAPLNGPDDEFTFKIDGVSATAASRSLTNIKVAPNPYFAVNPELENQGGGSALQFINLPDDCTLRIYTLAGDLVQTLSSESSGERGTIEWDLLSTNRQQIASGIYLYHVESPYGEHTGRFAVIK